MRGDSGIVPGGRIGTFVLAAGGGVGIVICILLTWPFLGAITWALALAILFVPVHAAIETRLKYPNLAGLVSVATLAIVVVVPAAFVVERLVGEAANGAVSIQARVAAGELQSLLDSYPSLAPLGAWIDQQIDLPSIMATLATWLSNVGATFVRGSVLQVAGSAADSLPAFLLPPRSACRKDPDPRLAAPHAD